MAFGSAMNSAHSDGQQNFSIIGVMGSMGTADTQGTAQTLPIGVDPATGAAYVYNLGPAGSVANSNFSSGTLTTGTLAQVGTVLGIGGTVQVSGASAGTNIQMVNGTLTLGTVIGKDANAAAQTANPIGIGGTDSGGTIRTASVDSTGALKVTGAAAGTNINIVSGSSVGTILGGTIQNLNAGTITALANGTITTGTVSVTTGTIVGPVASGGSETGNPVPIGGTDSGGTIRTPIVTSSGHLLVDIPSGTINVGTVAISNTPTVNVNSGTLNVGTVNATLVGGTLQSGTFTNTGTNVNVITGTVNVGTVTAYGNAAPAAVRSGNPIPIAGTDSGGTVYIPLVDNTGALKVSGASAGTNVNIVTGSLVGTILGGTLQNLVSGTFNSGTIVGNGGSIGAQGLAASAAAAVGNPVGIGGTDSGGTIRFASVDSTGAVKVSGASSGTFVNIVTGTINSDTIVGGTLQNLVSGTINSGTVVMTTGTIGTVTGIGTLTNVGSITNIGALALGTVYKGVGASSSGSLTAAGTLTLAGSMSDAIYWDIGGTWVGTGFFEGQIGTSSFMAINAITPLGVIGTQTTINGDFLTNAAGLSNTRFRLTYSSGTLTYNYQATPFYSPSIQLLNGSLTNLATLGTLTGAGVVSNLTNGSINILTGTLQNSGTTTGVGIVSNLTNGSINILTGTVTNLSTGTLNALASGTITGGTLQNLVSGTLNALAAGTITTGTMSITIGTITGKDANAAAQTAQPIGIGGTDSGGTIRTILVDSTGVQRSSGSAVMTTGTLTTGTLQNLVTGTINALASGTISGGTIQNLNAGTITALATGTITAGTIQISAGTVVRTAPASSAGSFTAAGTINLLGSNTDTAALDIQGTYVGTGFFEGQTGTSSWFAVNAVNQGGVVGTQTTGNGDYYLNTAGLSGARFRLTYSSGTLTYNAQTTPFQSQSYYLLGGSLSNLGSQTTVGTIGTVTGVGVVSNLTNGSVVMTGGTVTTGTLQNLVSGTLNALAAGTITTGTLQNLVTGTINALAAGTITTGTMSVTTGTLNGGTLTNINYGTMQIDPKPTPVKTLITSYGTTGTTGAAVFGTLVASVGAGTFCYITGYQIVVTSGTVDCAILDGTFAQTVPAGGTNMITRGQFVPGGGIARDRTIPYVSGTAGTVCYWMGGAGTVYFQVDYWAAT